MTAWREFVKKMFKNGRKKDKTYQLSDAMKDASSQYKKGGENETPVDTPDTVAIDTPVTADMSTDVIEKNSGDTPRMGGSFKKKGSKKTKKSFKKKGGKKSKKNYSKRH